MAGLLPPARLVSFEFYAANTAQWNVYFFDAFVACDIVITISVISSTSSVQGLDASPVATT
jgi:hypothetical protein